MESARDQFKHEFAKLVKGFDPEDFNRLLEKRHPEDRAIIEEFLEDARQKDPSLRPVDIFGFKV
tara:strand:+ start:1639 stop:1830 length:192 start_codon:yes stop_codon:yes gene_type:complete